MPRSLAYQFPARGQFYTSTDSAVTLTEPGILFTMTDCVFSAITNDQDPNNRLDGVTIPAGQVINGQTTGFTVTSGVAYLGLA